MSKIAIIGSGISGLVCAHRLSPDHEVEVFEANHYVGGHTATVDVTVGQKNYAIDTGFIVFNDRTYPRFQALLHELNVPYQETEMSFSVSNPDEDLIYNGNTLSSLFCQKKNMVSLRFLKFVAEILRFNKNCKKLYLSNNKKLNSSLGLYLHDQKYSDFFAYNYLLPMAAAIWSSSLADTEKMPLKFFINFFYNHGLLDVTNRPQWFTIKGGSRRYVEALIQACQAKFHLSTPVRAVRRTPQGVVVCTDNAEQPFDHVIMACHSDQALSLLAEPTSAEQRVLGAIHYSDNEVLLHQDPALLPQLPGAKASWNYHSCSQRHAPASVTYSMNILQRLPEDAPLFNVTLNNSSSIDPALVLRKFNYSHPVFSDTMVAAQALRADICGVDRIHYCGAYWYNGFHEDGVRSAEDICSRWAQE